jgi:hypothetical protein
MKTIDFENISVKYIIFKFQDFYSEGRKIHLSCFNICYITSCFINTVHTLPHADLCACVICTQISSYRRVFKFLIMYPNGENLFTYKYIYMP